MNKFDFCPRCSKKIPTFAGGNSRKPNRNQVRTIHKTSKPYYNPKANCYTPTVEPRYSGEIGGLNDELFIQLKESPKKALLASILSGIAGTGLCMVGPVVVVSGTLLVTFGSGVAEYGALIAGIGIVVAIISKEVSLIVISLKLGFVAVAIGSITLGAGAALQVVGCTLPFIGGGFILVGIGLIIYAIYKSKLLRKEQLVNSVNNAVTKIREKNAAGRLDETAGVNR